MKLKASMNFCSRTFRGFHKNGLLEKGEKYLYKINKNKIIKNILHFSYIFYLKMCLLYWKISYFTNAILNIKNLLLVCFLLKLIQ